MVFERRGDSPDLEPAEVQPLVCQYSNLLRFGQAGPGLKQRNVPEGDGPCELARPWAGDGKRKDSQTARRGVFSDSIPPALVGRRSR